jgi:hypothetical protein
VDAGVKQGVQQSVRLTVIDSTRVVSFPVEADDVAKFLGGCCSRPTTVEELLLATEAYHDGVTRTVTDALIDFDRHTRGLGASDIARRLEAGELDGTFEARDPQLREIATSARDDRQPLVVIDLESQTVSAPSALDLQPEGTIETGRTAQGERRKGITYQLPADWTIEGR